LGQKAHPYGLRLGYIKPWKAKWFAEKNLADFLHEDLRIRKHLKSKLGFAGISNIEIERSSGRVRVIIHTARPGVIIGRRGQEIDKIKEDLAGITQNEVLVDIKEVKSPQTDAQLIAENVAMQLEKRVGFRKAMKKAVQTSMTKGALGIKIICKGRLGGAEIARDEGYREGKVPLNTLRADVDYGFAEAFTTYGTIGVKVWLYKGDVLVKKEVAAQRLERERQNLEIEKTQQAMQETEKPKLQETAAGKESKKAAKSRKKSKESEATQVQETPEEGKEI
jgi:small subunit ribosomal protein S3